MAKKEKLWAKIGLLIFLGLIILGFTIPGFINTIDTNTQKAVEPRLCQTDSECYLTCNDKPLPTLCTKNLCAQNSCSEPTYYSLKDTPITFSLTIELNNKKIDLTNQSKSENFFVKYNINQIQLFSSGLNLNQVLEKFNAQLNNQCLSINNINYCSNSKEKLIILANGNETYAGGSFVPLEGDKIKIVYS